MLPYLARYMGHATVDSSYYYIHTSPAFMGSYAHITDKAQSVPESLHVNSWTRSFGQATTLGLSVACPSRSGPGSGLPVCTE